MLLLLILLHFKGCTFNSYVESVILLKIFIILSHIYVFSCCIHRVSNICAILLILSSASQFYHLLQIENSFLQFLALLIFINLMSSLYLPYISLYWLSLCSSLSPFYKAIYSCNFENNQAMNLLSLYVRSWTRCVWSNLLPYQYLFRGFIGAMVHYASPRLGNVPQNI